MPINVFLRLFQERAIIRITQRRRRTSTAASLLQFARKSLTTVLVATCTTYTMRQCLLRRYSISILHDAGPSPSKYHWDP